MVLKPYTFADSPPTGRAARGIDCMNDLALEIGQALRRARHARGLTLRELGQRSAGRFKSTSVAGYERAERKITVERFCELADFYGVAPARLLAHALRAAKGIPPIVVDLSRIDGVNSNEGRLLAQFAREILDLRGRKGTDEVTIRAGDLEVLATISGDDPERFLERIQPALRLASMP